MRKIPTLFLRDLDTGRHVVDIPHPQCGWVLSGAGVATRKYDGSCFMLDAAGAWWARRSVKLDQKQPVGYQEVERDENTSKSFGWEPAERSALHRYLLDATRNGDADLAGTYELCGPKINRNPEGFTTHRLIRHANAERLPFVPRTFTALRDYLRDFLHEGIVWHHPDGRMAKLKRRDFPQAQ